MPLLLTVTLVCEFGLVIALLLTFATYDAVKAKLALVAYEDDTDKLALVAYEDDTDKLALVAYEDDTDKLALVAYEDDTEKLAEVMDPDKFTAANPLKLPVESVPIIKFVPETYVSTYAVLLEFLCENLIANESGCAI